MSIEDIEKKKIVGERDFVSILNRQLPPEIVITGWAPVDIEFSARFSCTSRSYNYIFMDHGLNLEKMNIAAKKLIGSHNFQNFCTAQLERQNTHRECFNASVFSPQVGIGIFEIESSAFLYHQIRLTMTLLALIGNELEDITIIDELFDLEKYPRRPGFKSAHPNGLILMNCKFDG